MLYAVRDIQATIFLQRRLGQLREWQLEAAARGQTLPAEDVARREQDVVDEVSRNYYTRAARLLIDAADADRLSDADDYARRTTQLAEHGIWAAHRRLLAIPMLSAQP
jgi:hypothetical protein